MSTIHGKASEDLDAVFADIERFGLQAHLAHLEAYGYAVVENLLPESTLLLAREVILDLAHRQTGIQPDLQTGQGHDNWRLIPYLMTRHAVFQDILLNERLLALATYLVGRHCQLSSMSCHFKGMGRGGEIGLHTDTWMPPPLPRYCHVATVNIAMVDYSREGGALAVVPESHKQARNPDRSESFLSGPQQNTDAIPIEMSAGSMAVWHGNTWHGSYPRTIPGLRLNLSLYFSRPWMKVMERYAEHLPADVMQRHGANPHFRRLAGLDEIYGWTAEGPKYLDPKENVSIFPEDSQSAWQPQLRVRHGSRGWHY